MLRFLSNIPIFRRLFLSFTFMSVIPAVVLILLGSFYLNTFSVRGQAVQASFDAQDIASNEQSNLLTMNAALQTRHNQVFAALLNEVHDDSLAASGGLISADIAARETEFDFALKSYIGNYQIATSDNMSSIRNILVNDAPAVGPGIISNQRQSLTTVADSNGLWSQYKSYQDDELNQLQTLEGGKSVLTLDKIHSAYEKAYLTLWKANNVFTVLRNTWQDVVDDTISMGKTVISLGPSVVTPVVLATTIAVLVAFLVVFFTGWLLTITITNPLRRLASLTRHVGAGDTSARAVVMGRDEIAMVATSMNGMLDDIVHLLQQTQAQRDHLQRQVELLVNEVSGVGEGDLRIQAQVTPDSLGVLADAFNYMVEELSNLVSRVKIVASEVQHATSVTFDQMAVLVTRGEAQIQHIALAVQEVERMADYNVQVAQGSASLHEVAREAKASAEVGRKAMVQTVEGIMRIDEYVQDTSKKVQELGEHSRAINSIVEVITSVAHKTNRLALDAAVQSAMAGENGKGFGAVATDIRRLAEATKLQTLEIGHIIHDTFEHIDGVAASMQATTRETADGAKRARQAESSLAYIFDIIDRQSDGIEFINQIAIQQQQSSSRVVTMMHDVSYSTEQNREISRATAQNMEQLTWLIQQLFSSVGVFKTRDTSSQGVFGQGKVNVREEGKEGLPSISTTFRAVSAAYNGPNTQNKYGGPAIASPVTSARRRQEANNGNGNGNGNGNRNGNGNGVPRTPFPPQNGVPQAPFPSQNGVPQTPFPSQNGVPQTPFPPQQ